MTGSTPWISAKVLAWASGGIALIVAAPVIFAFRFFQLAERPDTFALDHATLIGLPCFFAGIYLIRVAAQIEKGERS